MVYKRIKVYGDMVMFRHTLFAMPFAVASVFMAAGGFPGWYRFLWVVAAMVGARNGANALNRIIDADIDAKNTRTAARHIPAGIVKRKEAFILTGACFFLFVLSAYMLNPLCLVLLPIPAVLFVVYSYTKRFTWLCHLILGAAIGGAPVGGWLAVHGRLDLSLLPAFIMGAGAALWVAGFDIIYATQDVDFDKNEGLHSIPVRFGIRRALRISSILHLVSVLFLCLLPFFISLGTIYYIGIAIISGLLCYEHHIVSPARLDSIKIASYSINQIIGIVFLVFSSLDVFV